MPCLVLRRTPLSKPGWGEVQAWLLAGPLASLSQASDLGLREKEGFTERLVGAGWQAQLSAFLAYEAGVTRGSCLSNSGPGLGRAPSCGSLGSRLCFCTEGRA